MATKRAREIEDFDSLEGPVPTASIHGMISSLSPVKKGKRSDYYVIDETSSSRFVGFKKSHQAKLKEFMDKKALVIVKLKKPRGERRWK